MKTAPIEIRAVWIVVSRGWPLAQTAHLQHATTERRSSVHSKKERTGERCSLARKLEHSRNRNHNRSYGDGGSNRSTS